MEFKILKLVLFVAIVQTVCFSVSEGFKGKNVGRRQMYNAWPECSINEFVCNDYITCGTYCNGVQECPSGEDEKDYACACPGGMNTYQCMDGSSSCAFYCNGITECSSGEDEEWCGCPSNQTYCYDDGTTCVKHCNGVRDCPNGEDEEYCPCTDPTKDHCYISDSNCVTYCNGISECMDGEDEWYCDNSGMGSGSGSDNGWHDGFGSGSGWNDGYGSGSGMGSGQNLSPFCGADEVKCINGMCIDIMNICSKMDSCSTMEDDQLCQDYGHIYGYYKRKVNARGLSKRVPNAELKKKAYEQAKNRFLAKKRAHQRRRGFQTRQKHPENMFGEKRITGYQKSIDHQRKSYKENDALRRLLQALSHGNKSNRK